MPFSPVATRGWRHPELPLPRAPQDPTFYNFQPSPPLTKEREGPDFFLKNGPNEHTSKEILIIS